MSNVTFELNGNDYNLPDYLSIEDYVKIFKVKDLFEDEYLHAKVINLLTSCPMNDLLEAEHHKVEFLSTSIFAMVPKPPYNLVDTFELNGVKYGYLPSYKEITFGEFADLDTLLTKKPEEVMDYLHIIAAIMYRPIISSKSKHNFKIEKYNQETLNDRAELFKKKLDVKFALGGQFFFTNFGKRLSNYTRLSLTQKIRREWEMTKWIVKNWSLVWKLLSKKDSDGTSSLIDYQITKSMNTIKSLTKKLSKR
jgi:hypothetical protein